MARTFGSSTCPNIRASRSASAGRSPGGELAGFIEYRRRPGLIAFLHTLIEPALRGPGPWLPAGSHGAHGRALRGPVGPSVLPVRAGLHRRPHRVPRPVAGRHASDVRAARTWLTARPPASTTEAKRSM